MIRTRFLLIGVVMLSCLFAEAQVEKLWENDFSKTINWQKVSSLGHYVIGTNEGLIGVNPETGQIVWNNNDFGQVTADQVQQVGSSPLFSINQNNNVFMIDPYSGKVKFNSQFAGVSDIRDQFVLYKTNGILISGRNSSNGDIIMMTSLEDGKVMWKIEEDYGRLVTVKELNNSEVLVVTIFYNYRVNTQSGEIVWKNDVSEANQQMKKLGAFGSLMKEAASNMAQDIEFNVQFYRHPTKDIFFVASEQESQSGFSSSSGTTVSYETNYTGFKLSDGSRIWKDPLVAKGNMGEVYFYEDNLVVMPNDPGNSKINLYDLNSQEGMWGKKGNGLKIKGGIYSYVPTEDGLLMVSKNASGKNYIYYLDLAQGILTFDKPLKIDGEMRISENTPSGLIYVTTEELNILNTSTGSAVLDKSIVTNPSLVTQDDKTLYVYDFKEGVIKQLDKATGKVSNLSGEIDFQGKESPENIELRSDGILLSSSQNMTLISFDGSAKYSKYLEAPREAGIIRALRYAQAVRAAYIGAASYAASAVYTAAAEDVKNEDALAGEIVGGVGAAYGQLGDAATDFAKKSFEQASARFKATKDANGYTVILTQIDKTNYLVKVDKNTGEEIGKINLGKDKAPDYEMDGVTGTVFYKTASSAVTGYKF
ncbi:PQQ-binding-like beta-propeller repeat protein [Fulvivirga lutimaris]|uniref:outer membrane protein assembly factor BamB family protein n=1 Tax=Fulvivirga lutimaris TaxID=1819566 RepID=UPI0012BCF8A3|nr:PQQ-binding-like beta-propeller repeat protein [Fulvivirga lutimaris]MTI40538.1 hypothetical protein [Fulvivirga lutimaris]